jgi:hypothetical protein
MVIGSRGIWTIDLSRGRFWHFRVQEFEGPRIVADEIAKPRKHSEE